MYYHQGNFEKAKATYDESNERLLTRIDNFFSSLSEEDKTNFIIRLKFILIPIMLCSCPMLLSIHRSWATCIHKLCLPKGYYLDLVIG